MILRALRWLAGATRATPGRVLALVALPACILAGLGAFVPVDLSFSGILDRENPIVAQYFTQSRELEFGGFLPLLLEGPEEKLDEAVTLLGERLPALDQVRRVDHELPTAWIENNALYLTDRETFDLWLGLATRPEDADGAKKLGEKLEATRAEVGKLRPEGSRVMFVHMMKDPLDFDAGGLEFLDLEKTTHDLLEPLGVQGDFAGVAAVGAQDQVRTLSKVQLLTPISLLLVLLLLRLVERSLLRLTLVALPMLLTVGATLGLTGTVLGQITVLESFFGVMVFGLGIDFALHLMVRLREERAAGKPYSEALTTTLTGAGRGVVAGALTTSGAFAIIAFAPDPTTRHLGVSGAIGLFVCLILMITLLPAAWTLLEKSERFALGSTGVTGHHEPREVRIPGVTELANLAVRHRGMTLALSLAVLFGAFAGAPLVRFETDLSRVFNRQVPALAAIERMQEKFELNSAPWITGVDTLDEARRLTKELEALDVISRVESLSAVLQPDLAERKAALQAASDEIVAQKRTYEALAPLVTPEEAEQMKGAIQLLEALEKAATAPHPTLENLPSSLTARLRTSKGKFLVYAYAKQTSLDGKLAKAEREQVQKVAPEAAGFILLIEAVMAPGRPWALPVFLAVLLFVGLVLFLDLRQWRMVVLALVPVVLGTAVAFGGLCWAGRPFNLLSALVVPLILGLGVDDGIHVVHRLKEDRRVPPQVAAASVGKAIVMTTATTCTSFAVLMFTDHAGMESMGLIMLIGLPVCLIASVTTLPALAHLLGVNVAPPGPPEA